MRLLIAVCTGAACAALLFSGCTSDDLTPVSDDSATAAPQDAWLAAAPDLGPTDDADNGAISTTYPAFSPDVPEVVSSGGPVETSPKFVPVFFSNDDAAFKTQIKDFISKVGATDYWKTAVEEYGVGAGKSLAPVELTETATGSMDDAAVQKWLAAKLNANDAAFPLPDDNTVYVLHYPTGVTLTQPGFTGTSTSCVDFGGYHNEVQLDGKHHNAAVSYAVIPRCDSFGGFTGIDAVTATLSHELIEAATDPFPQSQPANATVDEDHYYWSFILGGGETGDMCAQDPNSFTRFTGLDYTVQRTWSNVAAMAGHDPCIPHLADDVYFNTAPVLNDDVVLGFGTQSVTMKGVQIPVGSTATIELDLFSDGDTQGPWSVKVRDAGSLFNLPATLQLKLDRTHGQNGEKLHLTIKSLKKSQFGVSAFIITSAIGMKSHLWIGLVGQ